MSTAFVALGANLGDRVGTLRRAVERLKALGDVEAVSPVYETEPVGFTEQPAFLNAVARLRTKREPQALMGDLLQIEREMGRERTFRNAPRTIDLDLLFYDDAIIAMPHLTVPHPRLHERAFVLVPLADVAPDLIHPHFGASVKVLLARLGEVEGVRRTPHSLRRTRSSH